LIQKGTIVMTQPSIIYRNPFQGSGRKSLSFKDAAVGTMRSIVLTSDPVEREARDMVTKQVKRWEDNNPKMQIVVECIDENGEHIGLYADIPGSPKGKFKMLQAAFATIPGGVPTAVGCLVQLTFTGEEANPMQPNVNPSKCYDIIAVPQSQAEQYMTPLQRAAWIGFLQTQAKSQPFADPEPVASAPPVQYAQPVTRAQEPSQAGGAAHYPQAAPVAAQSVAPQAAAQPQMVAPAAQAAAVHTQQERYGAWTVAELVTLNNLADQQPAVLALTQGAPTVEQVKAAVAAAQAAGAWPNF